MMDENRAEDRKSCQTRQKSRASLKPGLVPEHDSILLYCLEEYVPQSHRGNLDRNGIQIACALNHRLRIPAGDHAHLMLFGSDFLDACDAKRPVGRGGCKNQINSPIRLAQLVEGSIHQEAAAVEHTNVICNALNFSNLMRREKYSRALGCLGYQHLQEMFDSHWIKPFAWLVQDQQFRAASE